jgi:hypothetical protein
MNPNQTSPSNLLDISSLSLQTESLISPITKEFILQLQETVRINLNIPPSVLTEYTTRLTMLLLDTYTIHPDQFCLELPITSPLWIAIIISNAIKYIIPNSHRNEHIHPIQTISLVNVISPKIQQLITVYILNYSQ